MAATPAQATETPVAAYSFDEGEGATAGDSFGENDGTVEGAEWVGGKYGNALRFESGEESLVSIPDDPSLQLTEAFTLEAWVRPQYTQHWLPVITKETPGFMSYQLYAGGETPGKAEGYVSPENGKYTGVSSPEALPVRTWSHLALTCDGEEMKLYLDGELVDTVEECDVQASSGDLLIGGNEVFSEYLNGLIDEVRIYDRALSPEEIESDMATAIETAPSQDPVAAYSFDEGEGATANDAFGSNHGAIEGAEWVGGKYGSALHFDNEDEAAVTIPHSPELELSGSFTLEAWVRPDHSQYWTPVLAKQTDDFFGYALYGNGENQGTPEGYVAQQDWEFSEAKGEAIEPRAWTHLAMTCDGQTLRLYVDGALADSGGRCSAQSSEGVLQIGANEVFNEWFNGTIDEVRIYNRALGAEEIEVDMQVAIQSPPAPDPIAAYSFDEGEGATAHDTYGDNDGTIDGAEWVTGKFGKALSFDREAEDSVETPASLDLDLSDAFTLMAWVKPEENEYWMPVMARETSSYHSYALYAAGEAPSKPQGMVAERNWEASEVLAEEALPVGEWAHLTLTSDGEDLKLYVDGELVDTVPASSAQHSEGVLRIGGHEAWGYYFDGLIDEVRVYERALGSEEIAQNLGAAVGVSMIEEPQIWGQAMAGERLQALSGRWSASRNVKREFAWLRCNIVGAECDPVEGAESSTFALGPEDVGDSFRVEVRAIAADLEETGTSDSTGPVRTTDAPEANGGPHLVNPLDSPSAPLVPGVTISIDDRPSGWYPFHSSINSFGALPPGPVDFQWQRCDAVGEECEDIVGAASYFYLLKEADVGGTVRVVSSAVNSGGSTSTFSEASDVIRSLAKPAAPSPLGAPEAWPIPPREKDTFIVSTNLWGGETGRLSQFDKSEEGREFEWLRCDAEGEGCSGIAEADTQTYELIDGDAGHTFRVRITAVNAAGEDSALSLPSEVVEEYVPEEPEVNLFESGLSHDQPLMGYQIKASYSYLIEHGHGEVTHEFKWLRCQESGDKCIPIPGASGQEYIPTGIDLEHTLRVWVKVSHEGGSDEDISNPSLVVKVAAEPEAVGKPSVLRNVMGGKPLAGNPHVGGELRASLDGVWNEGVLDHVIPSRWQWQRCSAEGGECDDVAGGWLEGSPSFYVPRERDLGYRLRVKVLKDGPRGDHYAVSELTDIVEPGALKIVVRPEVSGAARARERFVASEGTWTTAAPSLSYQWLRCNEYGESCEEIVGAVQQHFVSSEEDQGSALRVRVTAESEGRPPAAAISRATAALGPPTAPQNLTPPSLSGQAVVDEILQGLSGQWEGAEPLSYSWQWLRCDEEGEECVSLPGAVEPERRVRNADLGATLRLELTAENDLGTKVARSAPTAVVELPEAPSASEAPEMTGAMKVGEEVVAEGGEWSPRPLSFDYQWQACDAEGNGCEDLEGATERSLILPVAVEGGRIKVVVTAHNRGGEGKSESLPGDVIGPMAPPVNEVLPGLSSPRESREVEARNGEWAGGQPMSFAYKWLRCNSLGNECTEIVGASAVRYVPLAEDVGSKLKVKVTASNDAGSDSAVSKASSVVQVSAPWFADRVKIDGELVEGEELSADVSGLRGSAPIEVDYEWRRCFERCHKIPGAESQTYTLVSEDVAKRLRVKVTAENGQGEAGGLSPYSDSIKPAETTGSPKAAASSVIEGLPRVTEDLIVAEGDWRGAAPITESVKWQRCEDGPEFCEDIEGAIGAEYAIVGADQGMRLRAVITGTNAKGSGTSISTLTPPVLPAVNTSFKLKGESTLDEVLESAEEAGLPIVGINYVDPPGFYSGGTAGTYATDVRDNLANRLDIDPGEHHVRSVVFSGNVEKENLGSVENDVDSWQESPSLHSYSEPKPISTEYEGELELNQPLFQWVKVGGGGWPCVGEECEGLSFPELVAPREVRTAFTWGPSQEDMLVEIYENAPLALEFDLKLINPDNASDFLGIVDLGCSSEEEADFWISDRNDVSYLSEGIPAQAGLYMDTAASDPCTNKDLTWGLYHPEYLERDQKYFVDLYFFSPGNAEESKFELRGQLLERWPTDLSGERPCDYSVWCVNVPPYDNYLLSQDVILLEEEKSLPGCYEAVREEEAEECTFDL